jgi:hypothetical protein
MLPSISAITCDFSGWNVPQLSPDNTITIDTDIWKAYDENLGTVYTREIMKLGTEGNPIVIDPTLLSQDYLNIANDFLERNDNELNIEVYGSLEFDYDDGYPIVKFLGVNQICYDYYVVGSFAGAVKFTENYVYSLFSKWYKPIEISDDPPAIPPSQAAAVAGAGGGGGGGGGSGTPKLAILPLANDTFRLVYDVNLGNNSHVYVDAQTGDILAEKGKVSDNKILKSPSQSEFNLKVIIAVVVSLLIVVVSLLFWKKNKIKK